MHDQPQIDDHGTVNLRECLRVKLVGELSDRFSDNRLAALPDDERVLLVRAQKCYLIDGYQADACADRSADPLQVFRSRRGILRLELAGKPFENRVEITGYWLGLSESRLKAGDRVGEPGVIERLDEIVDGALLESLHRVVFVRGDEDDLGAPGDRARRVESTASGHVHVEELDTWPKRLEQLDRLAPVACIGGDLALRPTPGQASDELVTQERFVLGEQ